MSIKWPESPRFVCPSATLGTSASWLRRFSSIPKSSSACSSVCPSTSGVLRPAETPRPSLCVCHLVPPCATVCAQDVGQTDFLQHPAVEAGLRLNQHLPDRHPQVATHHPDAQPFQCHSIMTLSAGDWGLSTIGGQPLGPFNHWWSTIGGQPLGVNHWGLSTIGGQPLVVNHWWWSVIAT